MREQALSVVTGRSFAQRDRPLTKHHRRILVGTLTLALLGAAGSAQASDLDDIKATQAKILERLDAQDKVLKDILQKLQAQPAGRPAIDPNKVYAINLGSSPIRGPKDAPVTMVEFSDYQCPYCAQATGLVDQLLAAFPSQLRFVYKHMPLVQIHPLAMNASKAAVAAGNQGKFWEMHDALFAISKNLSPEEVKKAAEKLGLDTKKLETDMSSSETDRSVQDDLAVARATEVTSTPSFFINGRRVTTRTFDAMKAMVEDELKKASRKG